MSQSDLDRELRDMATDAPDSASIRSAVRVGFARRQKRVRTVALVATAAAVIVIAGGIGVASKIGLSSGPATATPDWQQHGRPVVIPPGSKMVPFTGIAQVISPVTATVDAPAATDTVFWQHEADSLFVGWTYAGGPKPSTATDFGSQQTADGGVVQRGYVINGTEAIPENEQPASSSSASPTTNGAKTAISTASAPPQIPATTPAVTRSVSVAGHAAVLTHNANTAWIGIFGGDRWLTWKLPDGRFVHAWVGAHDDNTLLAFAAGLLERPNVLARHVTVGVTLPGYTAETIQELGRTGVLDSAAIYLCPTDVRNAVTSNSTGACINIFVGNGAKMIAREPGGTSVVTVGGVTVRLGTDPAGAVALLDHSIGAIVYTGQLVKQLEDLDAATLAASVRVDPSITAR